jgi:hypothetical protein
MDHIDKFPLFWGRALLYVYPVYERHWNPPPVLGPYRCDWIAAQASAAPAAEEKLVP